MSRSLVAPFLLLQCVACGASPPNPESVEGAPPSSAGFRPPPPCRTGEDCLSKGRAAQGSDDARELFALACRKGSAGGCYELGKLHATSSEDAAARVAFTRICREPSTPWANYECGALDGRSVSDHTCVVDACARLAALPSDDAGAQLTYARRGCSTKGEPGRTERELRGRACLALARAAEAGGQAADARRHYQSACAFGNGEGCRAAPPGAGAPTSASASKSGGKLEMESLTTDGLVLRNVSCDLAGSAVLGVVGGMTVGAGFAKK